MLPRSPFISFHLCECLLPVVVLLLQYSDKSFRLNPLSIFIDQSDAVCLFPHFLLISIEMCLHYSWPFTCYVNEIYFICMRVNTIFIVGVQPNYLFDTTKRNGNCIHSLCAMLFGNEISRKFNMIAAGVGGCIQLQRMWWFIVIIVVVGAALYTNCPSVWSHSVFESHSSVLFTSMKHFHIVWIEQVQLISVIIEKKNSDNKLTL